MPSEKTGKCSYNPRLL